MKTILTSIFILITITHASFSQNLAIATPDTCVPRTIQFYEPNKVLSKEITICNGFARIIEYYPNGNLKMTLQFKEFKDVTIGYNENSANSGIREGKWSYFDESGDTLYNEFWQDGFFIKQVPEQSKSEIWLTDIYINGEHKPFFEMVSFEELKTLEVNLLYKNSHRDSLDLTIKFEIISPDQKHYIHTFTPENFKKINVKKLFKKAGIPPVDYSMSEGAIDLYPGDIDTRYFIKVLNNGILIANHEIYLYP